MKKIMILSSLFISSCAAAADPFELIEADRAFNDAVAAGGSQAWGAWFAEDGAMIQEGVGEIRGREQIQNAAVFLDDPAISLSWEPLRADISRSGDLGWTTGRFTLEMTTPTGSMSQNEGLYVSIWRRQADGTWKVVMDLGNLTTQPPAAP